MVIDSYNHASVRDYTGAVLSKQQAHKRQGAGGQSAHRSQVALCAPASPHASSQDTACATPQARYGGGSVVTCGQILMMGACRNPCDAQLHSKSDQVSGTMQDEQRTKHFTTSLCDALRPAAPPGMHLRWQGMHGGPTYGLGAAAQGMGDLAMLHHTVHLCAGRAWVPKLGAHRRVWETSPCCTTLDSPTSCKNILYL